jgi:hypothetical protein
LVVCNGAHNSNPWDKSSNEPHSSNNNPGVANNNPWGNKPFNKPHNSNPGLVNNPLKCDNSP